MQTRIPIFIKNVIIIHDFTILGYLFIALKKKCYNEKIYLSSKINVKKTKLKKTNKNKSYFGSFNSNLGFFSGKGRKKTQKILKEKNQ